MPKASHVGGYDPYGLLFMALVFAAALFVPAIFVRFGSSQGPSDSDSDEGGGGGGGGGFPRSPRPSDPSPGGIPLDDARAARVRLRDDRRLAQRLPARQRRQAREPARTPRRCTPTSSKRVSR